MNIFNKNMYRTISILILLMVCVGLCQAASEERQVTYDLGRQYPLEWSPNSEKILYTSETNNTWDLWVMNADGSKKLKLTDFEAHSDDMLFFSAWSPDSKKIAYTGETGSGIWVVNADGTDKEKISSYGILLKGAWSPDGSKMAYSIVEKNILEIQIMNSDGSDKKLIIEGACYPKWSPDGSKIAYWSVEEGVSIWIMNPDGSDQKRIVTEPLKESGEGTMFFYWSPDGTRILYHSDKLKKGRIDLWVVDTKTDEEKLLASDGGSLGWAHKDKIVYSVEDKTGIWMINPDGSGRELFSEKGFMGVLSPDGSKLAFVKSETGEYDIWDEWDIWVKSIDKLTLTPALTPTTIPTTTAIIPPTATPEVMPEVLPIGSLPVITNEGVKQLTAEPWDSKSFSWRQCAFSWSPDSTKIAYLSLENTFQEEEELEGGIIARHINNNLVLGVMNADGTGKIKCDEFSAVGDRGDGFLLGFDSDWSPDSKEIVYTKYGKPLEHSWEDDCDSASIWTMNTETTEKKKLAQRAMCPSLSPDGKLIVYIFKETPDANRDVWIMNADGSNKRKLASNAGYDALLASWSPDGTKIVYMSMGKNKWENVSIWITEADETNNFQLASNAMFPKWSPDGTKIAYASVDKKSDRPEEWQGSVWVVNLDGNERKCLLTESSLMGFMYFSKWSPDSTKIISDNGNEVVVLNSDGSGKSLAIPNYGSWSPDGKRIAYISRLGTIHVINSDGTNDKELLPNVDIHVYPLELLWSPDGTKITYTVGEEVHGPGESSNRSVWVMTIGEVETATTSTPTSLETPSSEEKGIPGFEVAFLIVGLLVVAHLLKKRK